MITIPPLNDIATKAHENAKAKGFWPEDANVNEKVMLIICELCEAIEALRTGKHAVAKDLDWLDRMERTPRTNFKDLFVDSGIKDTFEDEIADTLIRLLDLSERWDIDVDKCVELSCNDWKNNYQKIENISEKALELTVVIATLPSIRASSNLPVRFRIGDLICELFAIADHYGFDLMRHVNAKMKYNLSRPPLHGKNF